MDLKWEEWSAKPWKTINPFFNSLWHVIKSTEKSSDSATTKSHCEKYSFCFYLSENFLHLFNVSYTINVFMYNKFKQVENC